MQTTIRIGPLDFAVNIVDGLTNKDGGRKLNGQIIYDECIIQVESRISPQAQRLTLWHEIIHGILIQYNIKLENNEEAVVDALANGLMELLRDNPALGTKDNDNA